MQYTRTFILLFAEDRKVPPTLCYRLLNSVLLVGSERNGFAGVLRPHKGFIAWVLTANAGFLRGVWRIVSVNSI